MMFNKNLLLFTIFNLLFIQNLNSNPVNIRNEFSEPQNAICKVVKKIDYIFQGKIACAA